MKVDIDNPDQMLSRILLEDIDVVTRVANTEQWGKGIIEATVLFNGVEVPAEILEKVLHSLVKQVEDSLREKYDADRFDERVKEACEEKLQGAARAVIDAAYLFTDNAESIVYKLWEK